MMQTTTAKPIKVYVAVKTDFAADGTMLPREITWEDGEKYEIDSVLDIRQAAALQQMTNIRAQAFCLVSQLLFLFNVYAIYHFSLPP